MKYIKLVLHIAAKLVDWQCCTFYHPRSNLSSKKIRLLQVAWILSPDWIKLCRYHAIHRSFVTCCKTSLPCASKTHNYSGLFFSKCRTTLCFLQQLCNLQQPDMLQDRFVPWVVKSVALLLSSFCRNVAKQVARVCSLFYCNDTCPLRPNRDVKLWRSKFWGCLFLRTPLPISTQPQHQGSI